jgi:hypothetical protein
MKLRLVIAFLLGLAALGCGGGQGGGADPQAGTATDPASGSRGAPGAPGGDAGGDAGGSAGGGSRNAPGAPGAPGGGGTGPAARGAPINLPAFIRLQGLPLTVVMARIKGEIEVACGGSLCVKLVVQQGDEEEDDRFHPECFVRTEPPTSEPSVVYTDKPLVIVSGSNPTTGTRCPPDPSTDSTDPTTGSTDPTTGSTDPTTGSTDPTTESTDPTGDTGSAPSSS